ncbi:hypothetical protein EG68_03163 [Paragonimus skrjabini miyazakii]|uniref:Uncharacterized protein n=1 Tax=Paragonimus skrjabini miyazakii TaxID=59628 RepID=A0A8S9YY20_9TREM|nr:hypothetical protein EG68_03163 [Paragonimus skrjabini miyazakii]
MQYRKKLRNLLILNSAQHEREMKKVFERKIKSLPTMMVSAERQMRTEIPLAVCYKREQNDFRITPGLERMPLKIGLLDLRAETNVALPPIELNQQKCEGQEQLNFPVDDRKKWSTSVEKLFEFVNQKTSTFEKLLTTRMDAYTHLRTVARLIDETREDQPELASFLRKINEEMLEHIREVLRLSRSVEDVNHNISNPEANAANSTKVSVGTNRITDLQAKLQALKWELTNLQLQRNELLDCINKLEEENITSEIARQGDHRDYSKAFELEQTTAQCIDLLQEIQKLQLQQQKDLVPRPIQDYLLKDKTELLQTLRSLKEENEALRKKNKQQYDDVTKFFEGSELNPTLIAKLQTVIETGQIWDVEAENEKRWNWYIS